MHTKLPPLTPIISEWMTELMDLPCLLRKLVSEYGSPVNIHQTEPFHANYRKYEAVFNHYGLKHNIFFARKANKCKQFITAAQEVNMGLDTASYNELKECLDEGIEKKKLVVTAAVKNKELMTLAIEAGVLIILDNMDECELAQEVATSLKTKAKIGLRISGFEFEGKQLYSRFGFDINKVEALLVENFGKKNKYNRLSYHGLHFHLNGYSTAQRGAALHQSLVLAQQLITRGFTTKFIDIGGGFLMNYLKEKSEWEHFQKHLQKAVKKEEHPITFQNNGLGYEMIEDQVHGTLSTYPYYNETSQEIFLESILTYKSGQTNNAGFARELDVELRIEPGRSLLDQTGITVARVAFRKQDLQNNWLVGLEMNMTQLRSSSADFLLDPFLIPSEIKEDAEPVEVYFTGGYCLERDVLLQRKIALKQLPEVGDIVVFVNTAGYMMHFFESRAHLFDLAANLFYLKNEISIEPFQFVEDKGAVLV